MIVSETTKIENRRTARIDELKLIGRRKSIAKFYENYWNKMKPPIRPNLQVFRTLPSVTTLVRKKNLDTLESQLKTAFFLENLKEEIIEWQLETRKRIRELLGFDRLTYRSIGGTLDPELRLCALFVCKICKRVEQRYKHMGCLDAVGLCQHQCIQPDRKSSHVTRWAVCT